MKATLKQKMLKAMGMPEFISREQPELCMTGFESISVENYKSILLYTGETIVLQLVQGFLQIEGTSLCIKDIGDGVICIVGTISHISFPKEASTCNMVRSV